MALVYAASHSDMYFAESTEGEPTGTIVTYNVNAERRALRLGWPAASGGICLRSFAVSPDGILMAVGNQYSRPERLVLSAHDPDCQRPGAFST